MGSIETKQQYDNYILNLGYVYGDAEASPDDHLAYLSIGYRAGRFTPYALYQYRLMEHDASEMQLPAAPGPPPPRPPPLQPKDGDFEVDSYSIGFRYDLGATYAIKAQWEYQIINDDTNAVQGNQKDKENIYSIVFEGVF